MRYRQIMTTLCSYYGTLYFITITPHDRFSTIGKYKWAKVTRIIYYR